MSDTEHDWQVVGASVRGPSHVASGKPNQDALGWVPKNGVGASVTLCVSDGHGTERCFRSDVGSRLAVRIAGELGAEFMGEAPDDHRRHDRESRAHALGRQIVTGWASAVRFHVSSHPFTADELERGDSTPSRIQNPLVAYGATILMAVVFNDTAVVIQLGDGSVLAVTTGGRVEQPLAADEVLLAGETRSLCLPDAHRYVRVACLPTDQLAFLLLASDGYGNAFRDAAWQQSVGFDLLAQLRSRGATWVGEQLERWAHEAAHFSGDDVTVGIAASLSSLADVTNEPPASGSARGR